MKTLFKLMVMLVVGLAAGMATAKEHRLEIQIQRNDGMEQVFTLSVNGRTYNTDRDGRLVFSRLQNGMYVVTPTTIGFKFEPAKQHVVLRTREVEKARFTAIAAPATTPVVAMPKRPLSSSSAQTVPGDYKLRVEVRRQDGARRAFDLTINNQPYRTKVDGTLEIDGLAQGAYAVNPTSEGFTYEPVVQTVYLKYRKQEQVRFYATASDLVTPSVAIIVEPAALKVPEGGTVNLAVKLSGPPEEDIALAVSYAGDPDIKVSPSSLMFTSSDWNAAKSLTVTAAGDDDSVAGIGNIRVMGPNITLIDVPVAEVDTSGPTLTGSHADRIVGLDPLNVTRTCLKCHMQQGLEVWDSVHYQWLGETDGTSNVPSPAGKINGINDFCLYVGNTEANWIGKMVNLHGVTVDGGCARCHAGLGARPDPNSADTLQLENIDCLICHSPKYRRTVKEIAPGTFRFVPDEAAMGVTTGDAAADIHLTSRGLCLQCHGRSGGGDNFKRGDIEMAHLFPTRAFDAHMGTDGQNFDCITCHFVDKHRFAGRGVDLQPVDNPGAQVRCENCHTADPHADIDDSKILNRHGRAVNCTTCHIPRFAKVAPTDIFRDWSQPAVITDARLYEPWIQFATNVMPEYKWWNGTSAFYVFGTPAVPAVNGKVGMAMPNGHVNDPQSRIYAMKHHLGNQPVDSVTQSLLPLKASVFFQTGDVTAAIIKGLEAVGQPYNGHRFMPTERYLGIFHEVAPKAEALKCVDCHNTQGEKRLDFIALGYGTRDSRNGQALCTSCHGRKEPMNFQKLHIKHVDDKRVNCIECHYFQQRP